MKAFRCLRILLAFSLVLAACPPPAGRLSAAPALGSSALLAPWFITTVDTTGDVGRYASLALHPQTGRPYIAYVKQPSGAIETAHLTPGAGNCVPNDDWTCNDTGFLNHGGFLGFAFAPAGDCRYVFQPPTAQENRIDYFEGCFGHGGGSSDSRLDSVATGETGLYNSLKFDFGGVWHLAFQSVTSTASLRYAEPVNGFSNCNFARCDVIDSGAQVGAGASLDVDGAGAPRIAYRGAAGHLTYARYISPTLGNCGPAGTWQCDLIDAGSVVTHSISLYEPKCGLCSVNDLTRIAYYDQTSGFLKIAVRAGSGGNCGPGGTWQCDALTSLGSLDVPGVSLAAVGDVPLIAYTDADDYPQSPHDALKIARPASAIGLFTGNCGPANPFFSWQCDTLDDGGFFDNNEGQYPSLAINSAGLATIAYYDATDGKLKLAWQRFQVLLPLVVR